MWQTAIETVKEGWRIETMRHPGPPELFECLVTPPGEFTELRGQTRSFDEAVTLHKSVVGELWPGRPLTERWEDR